MQSVMQEEMRREMLRTQYEQGRKDVINSALSKYDSYYFFLLFFIVIVGWPFFVRLLAPRFL